MHSESYHGGAQHIKKIKFRPITIVFKMTGLLQYRYIFSLINFNYQAFFLPFIISVCAIGNAYRGTENNRGRDKERNKHRDTESNTHRGTENNRERNIERYREGSRVLIDRITTAKAHINRQYNQNNLYAFNRPTITKNGTNVHVSSDYVHVGYGYYNCAC